MSVFALLKNVVAVCSIVLLSGCFEAREFIADRSQRVTPIESPTRWYAYELFGNMNVRLSERNNEQRYVDIEPLGSCYLVDQHDGSSKKYMTAIKTRIPNFWALVQSTENCELNDTLNGSVMGLVKSRGVSGTKADYFMIMSLEKSEVNKWAEILKPEIRENLNILPLDKTVDGFHWSIGSATGLSLMISQNASGLKFLDTAYSSTPGQCRDTSVCSVGM